MLNSIDFADLIDRRILQAERDVARAERRAEQAEQAMAAAAAAARVALQGERERTLLLQMHLDQVYASTSWRVSRAVRVASRLVQALRNQPAPTPLPELPTAPAKAPSLPPREHAILRRLQNGQPS